MFKGRMEVSRSWGREKLVFNGDRAEVWEGGMFWGWTVVMADNTENCSMPMNYAFKRN
jgi:hypothetical protein